MSSSTHTLIVGPGAIGCALAAELACAGRNVTLLDHREDRARRLSSRGITIEDGDLSHAVPVRATHNGAVAKDADLVVISVKAHATAAVAASLEQHVRSGSTVLTVQNGLGNVEALRDAMPQAHVTAGVIYFGSRLLDEGHVVVTPNRRMVLGEPDSETTALICQALDPTRIRLELVDGIDHELWRKAIVNAVLNPLTAIHRVPNGELPAVRQAMEVAEAVVHEAVDTARAHGQVFDADDLLAAVVHTCESTATNVSSMRQDVEAGRPTEIEAINGALVERGREAGIAVPANEMLVRAITALT